MVYVAFLVFLVYLRRSNISKISGILFLMFVAFSGVAVLADNFFPEGLVNVFGVVIGFEQLFESASALILSTMFASIASAELLDHRA